jgi:hypothetical protein
MNTEELDKLYKQLEPILVGLAETHTKNDRISIEYPFVTIFIDFK